MFYQQEVISCQHHTDKYERENADAYVHEHNNDNW